MQGHAERRNHPHEHQQCPDEPSAWGSRLLTLAEAAEKLRVSARSLWSLANTGNVRQVRIGRSVRFDPADIRAFIERAKA